MGCIKPALGIWHKCKKAQNLQKMLTFCVHERILSLIEQSMIEARTSSVPSLTGRKPGGERGSRRRVPQVPAAGLPGPSENIRRTAAICGALSLTKGFRCHEQYALFMTFFYGRNFVMNSRRKLLAVLLLVVMASRPVIGLKLE